MITLFTPGHFSRFWDGMNKEVRGFMCFHMHLWQKYLIWLIVSQPFSLSFFLEEPWICIEIPNSLSPLWWLFSVIGLGRVVWSRPYLWGMKNQNGFWEGSPWLINQITWRRLPSSIGWEVWKSCSIITEASGPGCLC